MADNTSGKELIDNDPEIRVIADNSSNNRHIKEIEDAIVTLEDVRRPLLQSKKDYSVLIVPG